MSIFSCGLYLLFSVPGSVFAQWTPRWRVEGLGKDHFKVVTIPDQINVVQTRAGGQFTYSGPYIALMDRFAAAGNFTYDVTAQADGNFGKKVNGTWNGMVGDILKGETSTLTLLEAEKHSAIDNSADAEGPIQVLKTGGELKRSFLKYDIILNNVAFSRDIDRVLSGCVDAMNVTEWTVMSTKTKTDRRDYIVRKNIDYFLLKNSEDPASKAIWKNIKDRLPASIVNNTDDIVKQVKAGKFFVTGDNGTLESIVASSNGELAVDSVSIMPHIEVCPFATRKATQFSLFLNSILSGDEQAAGLWMQDTHEFFLTSAGIEYKTYGL